MLILKKKLTMKKIICLIVFQFYFIFAQPKFAWITDTHIGSPSSEKDLLQVINFINSLDINFTILTGDVTEKGFDSELEISKDILSRLKKPYFLIPGNHDTKWSESGCISFSKLFGDNKFYFRYGEFVFIGINSGIPLRGGGGHISKEDLIWLKKIFNGLDKSSIIIFAVHHPLNEEIDNYNEIVKLLYKFQKAFIIVGHGHTNKYYDFCGINGAMGKSTLSKNNSAGFNIVKLTQDSVFVSSIENGNEKLWYNNSLTIKKLKLNKTCYTEEKEINYKRTKHHKTKIKKIYSTSSTLVKSGYFDGENLFLADLDGNIYSLKTTGNLNWYKHFNTSFFSKPIKIHDRLFLGGIDGYLYILNTKDGNLINKLYLNAPIIASPIYHKESNTLILFSNDGRVNYISLFDFSIKKRKISNGHFESIPEMKNEKIIIGSWDNFLYAVPSYFIDSLNYYWKWTENRNFYYSPSACKPFIDRKNRVYISTPDKFISVIDLKDGKTIYRSNQFNSWEAIGLNQMQNLLFIKSVKDTIYALNIDSNFTLKWKNSLDYGIDTNPIHLTEQNGLLFIPAKNGTLFILDSNNGTLINQIKLSNSRLNDVIPISSKKIIITSMDGEIYVINFGKVK